MFPSKMRWLLPMAVLFGSVLLRPALARVVSAEVIGLPVFPGEVGFAAPTPAERGGAILKVTNLRDAGAGSLRAAVETPGARIVVFEVSGTISLRSDLIIAEPYLTVAGQTAPSPGITLRGATVLIETHDVLLRHLRIRAGDEPGPNRAARDGITIQNAANVIVDHCSVSWAIDENICIKHADNITISNCLVAEALNNSFNAKGKHSKGILVSYDARKVTLLRNVFAHHADRHPNVKDRASAIAVNNLYYNFGDRAASFSAVEFPCSDEPCVTFCSIGDVYVAGPDTRTDNGGTIFRVHPSVRPPSRIYVSDTLVVPASLPLRSGGAGVWVDSPPFWDRSLPVLPAEQVESYLLAHAGARPADRDPVDRRVVAEVQGRGGRIIDSQREVGGWPTLAPNYRAVVIAPIPESGDAPGYPSIEELLQERAAQVEGR